MTAHWIVEDFNAFENIHLGFFTIFINVIGPFDL